MKTFTYKADGRNISFDYETKKRGLFARVYLGEKEVLSVVPDECTDKEILRFARQNACAGKVHLPDVSYAGETKTGQVYKMPRYLPLRAAHKSAWTQYKTLSDLASAAYRNMPARAQEFHYRDALNSFNDTVQENESLDASIKDAIDSLVSWAENYDHQRLEFCQRNVAVTQEGNLILLDVLFNYKEVERIRKSKKS